ncbi:hypothetical protein [Cellulophaga baltica]|uniref:hypothetical protein n=1 Tax=Cellulophaga baltica TaxID=76594 RepID=UPI0015F4D994|nr:hypothetical protein [Cellulophaga baltica]MBA6316593.1 hypothetical protein [Cellulophaga baltica]
MTKNILIIVLLSIVMFSCKETSSKANDSIEIKNQTTDKIVLVQVKGGGSEPGWSIVISKEDKQNFTFELITMLGEKNITGKLTLENDFSEKENSNLYFKGNDSNKEIITILFKNESCLDMAGNNLGGMIKVEWNNQILKGCAELATKNSK